MSGAGISISVFFPCHNEEGAIEHLTHRTLEVLKHISDDYEVIIVNDGSSDATGAIADRLGREDEHVKAVHHLENRGYGGALQSGFRTASPNQRETADLSDIVSNDSIHFPCS